MPDLTLQPMAMCASYERFEVKVKGSKGATYAVTHGRVAHGDCLYDFACTCPAFKFRPGHCKHIKAVESQACLWHEQSDGGAAVDGKCPRCNGPVIGIMCAV